MKCSKCLSRGIYCQPNDPLAQLFCIRHWTASMLVAQSPATHESPVRANRAIRMPPAPKKLRRHMSDRRRIGAHVPILTLPEDPRDSIGFCVAYPPTQIDMEIYNQLPTAHAISPTLVSGSLREFDWKRIARSIPLTAYLKQTP